MKINSVKLTNYKSQYQTKKSQDKPNFKQNNTISNVYNYHPSQLSFNGLFFKPIDFTKAKTLDEAIEFGQKHLGIEKYYRFDESKLDIINFINEGLTKAKNKTNGSIRLPAYVTCESIGIPQAQITCGLYSNLDLNSEIYSPDKIDDEICRIFNSMIDDGVIQNSSEGNILNSLISNDETDEFFKKLNEILNSNFMDLEYDEKLDLYMDLRKIYERTSNMNRFPKDLIVKMLRAGCFGEIEKSSIDDFEKGFLENNDKTNFSQLFEFLKNEGKTDFDFVLDLSRFHTIFHELGHLQSQRFVIHYPIISDYKNPNDYNEGMKDWLNSKEKMQAAFKVSPYACYGVPEFIAESYAWLMQGKKLPPDAQKLYNHLGGPKVKKVSD